jgi:hypothetical protein
MNAVIEPQNPTPAPAVVDDVIARGDLSKLTPAQRVVHYHNVCRSLGLNHLTEPFQYITLNGKLKLYAKRDAADQLRKLNGISLAVVSQSLADGLMTMRVRATDKTGRTDEDVGVVAVGGLKGEAAANAFMKAMTKAKRRVTLSIAGLGFLDETEVDDIPAADKAEPQRTSGDDYEERWLVSLGDYEAADDLAAAWNGERSLRNGITWSDDQQFARLKAEITRRIEELKRQPDLKTRQLEAEDS